MFDVTPPNPSLLELSSATIDLVSSSSSGSDFIPEIIDIVTPDVPIESEDEFNAGVQDLWHENDAQNNWIPKFTSTPTGPHSSVHPFNYSSDSEDEIKPAAKRVRRRLFTDSYVDSE